jgi:hypothetical protein
VTPWLLEFTLRSFRDAREQEALLQMTGITTACGEAVKVIY